LIDLPSTASLYRYHITSQPLLIEESFAAFLWQFPKIKKRNQKGSFAVCEDANEIVFLQVM